MTDVTIVSMKDLEVASAASETDTFAICQNDQGCGPNDPLAAMSLRQLADYLVPQVPPLEIADLPPADVAADTDMFAVVQTGPLAAMTLAQVAALVLDKISVSPSRFASVVVPYADRVPNIANSIAFDIAHLDLDVGDWLVTGEGWFVVDSGLPLIERIVASLSMTQAMVPAEPDIAVSANAKEPMQSKQGGGTSTGVIMPLSQLYISTPVPIRYYLNGLVTWSGGGTMSAYGKIIARTVPLVQIS